MFKADIIKLFKSKFFYIILTILFAFIIYGVIDFNNNYNLSFTYSGYGITKYESKEDLLKFKQNQETIIIDLEEELNDTSLTRDEIKEIKESLSDHNIKIKICDYLIENDISYNEYMDFLGTCSKAIDNSFSATYYIYCVLYYALPFVMSLLAIFLISYDFHKGTYKFLYSTNVSRTKVAKNKYVVLLFISTIVSIICFFTTMFISFNFGCTSGKVIFANNDSIFALNYLEFYLISSLDVLFRTILISSFIYGITLFFKYFYVPLIFCLIILITNIFVYFNTNHIMQLLNNGLFTLYLGGNYYNFYIIIYLLIFILLASLTLILGKIRFNKCNFK